MLRYGLATIRFVSRYEGHDFDSISIHDLHRKNKKFDYFQNSLLFAYKQRYVNKTFQAFKSIKQHVNLNFSAYFETTCIQYTTVAGVIAMLACGGHLILYNV